MQDYYVIIPIEVCVKEQISILNYPGLADIFPYGLFYLIPNYIYIFKI